jgi:4-hydroxybutyryl-CoA dehydratase/vinylacetyl-CoA-Delta-isomerase
MLLDAAGYRESLRAYRPRVFIGGRRVESVADEPLLAPGIAGVGVAYELAHREACKPFMTARQATSGKIVNRMLHLDASRDDLLAKLEAVRILCKAAGCAQRYLTHDAFNAIAQATARADAAHGGDYHARFLAYMHRIQGEDLTCGVAMTDAKGDRPMCTSSSCCRAAPMRKATRISRCAAPCAATRRA